MVNPSHRNKKNTKHPNFRDTSTFSSLFTIHSNKAIHIGGPKPPSHPSTCAAHAAPGQPAGKTWFPPTDAPRRPTLVRGPARKCHGVQADLQGNARKTP